MISIVNCTSTCASASIADRVDRVASRLAIAMLKVMRRWPAAGLGAGYHI